MVSIVRRKTREVTVMPPKKRSKEKLFILVRWLVDETVGVMPLTALHRDCRAHVGAVVEVKYGRKFYQAEVLKISGECYFT